ncbi:PiggyBac transposable element-derived protein 3 [Amphibalanus amphitrite]|uniref:PiggyBac transposable element-derived protein 3 n=1 Tax=Amphibalanus amphitrite TaxID=1232801 RepID=A0A6A4W843_AMPAM|nr:PiggyBac transposable element-derived protein 3 [Amphibalanus amphitrite]
MTVLSLDNSALRHSMRARDMAYLVWRRSGSDSDKVRYRSLRNRVKGLITRAKHHELKAFIGILLYSGYNTFPSEQMYWSKDDDLARPIVRQAMTRSDYLKIKSYLHVQDNNIVTARKTVASSDGYCYKFDLYCGKEERPELRDQPLGTRVVMDMLSMVSDPGGH